MKKYNIILTTLSLCGVVTVFAFVAANTIRTNNAKQSVVSTKGYEYPEFYEDRNETEVAKGVTASVPVTVPKEELPEEEIVTTQEISEAEEYLMPVSGGKIINEFTDTILVFQETYGDYRTHLGLDIEADKNTPVLSVKDGIVIRSELDYEEGYVVEIEHKDGIVSVYKNLTTNEIAPIGKVVSAGETIGAVGTSGIFEGHLPPHLHFEILEDNVEMNPLEYLK